jgi:hypothetical protein
VFLGNFSTFSAENVLGIFILKFGLYGNFSQFGLAILAGHSHKCSSLLGTNISKLKYSDSENLLHPALLGALLSIQLNSEIDTKSHEIISLHRTNITRLLRI